MQRSDSKGICDAQNLLDVNCIELSNRIISLRKIGIHRRAESSNEYFLAKFGVDTAENKP